MKTFDEIYALATSPLHAEYAENFTHPRLSWGAGVTQGVAVAMQEMQAEIDALKAQRDALLAAQEGTPCKHKFHVDAGGVLFCVYCSASFSEQKEAIAKARGDRV